MLGQFMAEELIVITQVANFWKVGKYLLEMVCTVLIDLPKYLLLASVGDRVPRWMFGVIHYGCFHAITYNLCHEKLVHFKEPNLYVISISYVLQLET